MHGRLTGISTRRGEYDPWDVNIPTIRLKAKKVSAHETAHSQDPGYALEPGIFLGLFDVTRRRAVAACSVVGRYGAVWHCFDTVLTSGPYSISRVGTSYRS